MIDEGAERFFCDLEKVFEMFSNFCFCREEVSKLEATYPRCRSFLYMRPLHNPANSANPLKKKNAFRLRSNDHQLKNTVAIN